MTDPAQTAVIEAMLMSWSDSPAGRKVTFLLPDDGEDHPFKHLKAGTKYGQRMAVSFALIDDDETETPVMEAAQATPAGCDETGMAPDSRDPIPITPEDGQHAERDAVTEATWDYVDAALKGSPAERRQMTAANVAGMLTGQVVFQTFLQEQFPSVWARHEADCARNIRPPKEVADRTLKELTGVESKTQFDRPGTESADRWSKMQAHYDVWRGIGT